jgi:hypothetical protein
MFQISFFFSDSQQHWEAKITSTGGVLATFTIFSNYVGGNVRWEDEILDDVCFPS